jgi:hypothetical protein
MAATLWHSIIPRHLLRVTLVAVIIAAMKLAVHAQLIYQEDFETDGEAANPKRYTTVGGTFMKWIDPTNSAIRTRSAPSTSPITTRFLTQGSGPDARSPYGHGLGSGYHQGTPVGTLNLFDSAIKWLLNDKTGAKIVVAPPAPLWASSVTD